MVAFAAPALAAGLSGCVSSGQGEVMRQDIAALATRVETIEERDVEAAEAVKKLRKVLDEATQLLTRNSADVGAKVAKAEVDLAALEGRIEEAKYALAQLEADLGARVGDMDTRLVATEAQVQKILDKVAPEYPDDPDQMWAQTNEKLTQGARADAVRFLRVFTQKFPKDARVPKAHLALGGLHQDAGDASKALREFNQILDKFPKSRQAPAAMLNLGASMRDLKLCSDAGVIWRSLIKKHPRSSESKKARRLVKDLRKLSKDRSKCAS